MHSEHDNMVDEVAAEFQTAQDLYGDDVSSHKAEMGLEAHENFILDDFMDKDEQDMLNSDLDPKSPEYKNIIQLFLNRVQAHSMTEITAWVKARASESSIDHEKILEDMLNIQEQMKKLMELIMPLQKEKDNALKDLDSWVKRFNKWKASPQYKSYPDKSKAHKIFFTGLNIRKSAYETVKERTNNLSVLWSRWNSLKSISDGIARDNPFVWTLYFNLEAEELSRYFTAGDTEDVDDFSLLANNQADVMDIIAWQHVVEMQQSEMPEADGIGFWSFKEEYRVKSRSEVNTQEDEFYLLSLMNSEPAF